MGEMMPEKIPSSIQAWQMVSPGSPLELKDYPVPEIGPADVLVKIAGCGLCHTDLGFLYGGVKTRHEPPLTLGHEISGRVVAAGETFQNLVGKNVVVPAVIPCGECELCRSNRGNACRKQLMPGNDFHGGFASHVYLPGRFLCVVDDLRGFDLAELSVIADAVTTPYMAVRRAEVKAGDLCIVVGVGGVGGYAVQISSTYGAKVIALDIDAKKLEKFKSYGADYCINAKDKDVRAIQKEVRDLVKKEGLPPYGWKVFEMSGTGIGQEIAYALLSFAGSLMVVGFAMEKVSIRLSNLMAFDASAIGTWGCLPEYYHEAVELALTERIKTRPFSSRYPMGRINEVIDQAREHKLETRAILEPDF
jgi:6-hydroxycyclohex-1-ene-1-carbonyl-CoA dehydrogenase